MHVRKVGEYKPRDADDLFDLGVGERATRAMEDYFARAPQTEEEIRVSVSGTMDAAWAAFNAGQGGRVKRGQSSLEMRGRGEAPTRCARRESVGGTRGERSCVGGDIREERDVTRA